MRLLVVAALCPALLLSRSLPAEAKCATPGIAVAPADGSAVPPEPTIYLFVPQHRVEDLTVAIDVPAAGVRRSLAMERVHENDAFVAFRVGVELREGDFVLKIRTGSGASQVRYRIDPDWKRQAGPVALHGHERILDTWMCSYTDVWSLEVGDAPAYRVEWAISKEAWEAGDRSALIVPHRTDDFWLWGDTKAESGHGRIDLGHLNCFDHTIPPDALTRPIYVSVQGLYPDGSVSAEWGDAVRLGQGGHQAGLADNLNESIDIEVAELIAVPPPPVVAPAPAPASAALEPAGWGVAALAVGIPIAVLLAAALRRRRMAAARLVAR